MFLSIYTAVKNCVSQDYPYIEMIKHHLPLADEIVINEGYSTDGTFESLEGLSPKVKVFRNHWNPESGEDWWIHFKDQARLNCGGDWCIHLDCDEFIPEWQFDEIRDYLSRTDESLIPTRFTNFYGNYRVYHSEPASINWITRKMNIHRNVEDVEFWGDGSNLKLKDQPFSWGDSEQSIDVFHFGSVRDAALLRKSWWKAGRFRSGKSIAFTPPTFIFKLFPHNWLDDDFLAGLKIYDGPLMNIVKENPESFIRDDMRLYHYLERLNLAASEKAK